MNRLKIILTKITKPPVVDTEGKLIANAFIVGAIAMLGILKPPSSNHEYDEYW